MLRLVTSKLIVWIALLVVCGTLISCGGSNISSPPGQPIPNIAGPLGVHRLFKQWIRDGN
jgi:hypothetical protein